MVQQQRAAIYVNVSEEPTSGEAFLRNVDKFRSAEEVAARLDGNTHHRGDQGGDGTDSTYVNVPTVARIPKPKSTDGAVSKGRQAVLERERSLAEAEQMRKVEKKTTFVAAGSSGAEGRYRKTTQLVSPLGVAKKKSFDDLP